MKTTHDNLPLLFQVDVFRSCTREFLPVFSTLKQSEQQLWLFPRKYAVVSIALLHAGLFF